MGRRQRKTCIEKITFINPVCGHQNKALCFEADLIRLWKPWPGNEAAKPKLTKYVTNYDEENSPIIAYSMNEEVLELTKPPKEVSKEALVCSVPILLYRKCGHYFRTSATTSDVQLLIGRRIHDVNISSKLNATKTTAKINNFWLVMRMRLISEQERNQFAKK